MWQVLLLGAMSLTVAQAERGTLQVKHTSLSNDPLVESGYLARTPDGLHLGVRVRFMNECLAKAGAHAEVIDVPLAAGEKQHSLRVVLVRQNVSPKGCPDIYMPVVQLLHVPLTAPEILRIVVVLNTAQPFSNLSGELRAHSFDLSGVGPLSDQKNERQIEVGEMNARMYFPALKAVGVSNVVMRPGDMQYTIDFELATCDTCQGAGEPLVEIYESGSGQEGAKGEAHDWLVVSIPNKKPCLQDSHAVITRRYRVTTEVSRGQRDLVLVNRVAGGRETERDPFLKIEVEGN